MLTNGEIPAGFSLWRNTEGYRGTHYSVTARWISQDRKNRGRYDFELTLGNIQVGDEPEYTLAELLGATPVPVPDNTYWRSITQQDYDDMMQAKADAEDAAASAALYGPLTFPSASAFFASSAPDASMIGKRAGTQDGTPLADLVASGTGDFDHPVTGIGIIPVGPLNVYKSSTFGAVSDIAVNNTPALQRATAAARGKVLDLGAGEYGWGAGGGIVAASLDGVASLHFRGDGALLREITDTTASRWSRILPINLGAGITSTLQSVTVEGLNFDHGGSRITNKPPGDYDWEQAHCVSIDAHNGGNNHIEQVTIRDVNIRDKIGGGVVLASGFIRRALLENVHGSMDFGYGQGERGDIEVQACCEQFVAKNCSGRYFQTEPIITGPIGGIERSQLTFSDCRFGTWDLAGYSGNIATYFSQEYILENCENTPTGQFWIRHARFQTRGGRFHMNGGPDFRNLIGAFDGTEFVIGVKPDTNAFNVFTFSAANFAGFDVTFRDLSFTASAAANSETTGYAVGMIGALPIANDKYLKSKITFDNVKFSPAFQYTAQCYRNGGWEFRRCKLTSRAGGWAIVCGGDTLNSGSVVIDSCDLSQVAGSLVRVAATNATWRLTFRGQMDYAGFKIEGAPTITNWQDTNVIHEAIWLSDARPAAAGLNGMRVRLRKPVLGAACEWVCTSGSYTTATWRMVAQAGIAKDTTANRPVPHANDIGLQYLDTTLDADGKPILWNGTAWVDATGATV